MQNMLKQLMERPKSADPNAAKKREIRVRLMAAKVAKLGLTELERRGESLTDGLPQKRG